VTDHEQFTADHGEEAVQIFDAVLGKSTEAERGVVTMLSKAEAKLLNTARVYGAVAAEFAATDNVDAWLEAHHNRLLSAENEMKDAARVLFDGEERGHFFDAKKAAEAINTIVANGEIPF
jgi:hypothetical protein